MKIYVCEALIFMNHCQSLEILSFTYTFLIYLLEILHGQIQLFWWKTYKVKERSEIFLIDHYACDIWNKNISGT